jgi:hypothetical protein
MWVRTVRTVTRDDADRHNVRQLNTAAAAAPEAPNFQAFNNAINGMTASMHEYTQQQEKVGQQLQLIANQTPNAIL